MALLQRDLASNGVLGVSSHLGMWVPSTPYARNASAFGEWFVGNASAIPLSREFFAFIFGRAAREWGLAVVEQDHMAESYEGASALTLGTIDGFERWLAAEGAGADDAGVSIEYCMDQPNIIINSATVARATHARASGDYVPPQASWQWDLGVTSALLWSVGLYPSKDVYFTSSSESYTASTDIASDCLFSGFREPFPLTHHAAAVLSAGLVQPSDGINSADYSLIRTAARSDGILLKPDRPLMRVEATWEARMFGLSPGEGAPPRTGSVSSTFTLVGGLAWHYLFAAILTAPYNCTPSDLFPAIPWPDSFARRGAETSGAGVDLVVVSGFIAPDSASPSWRWDVTSSAPFSDAAPLALAASADYSVQLALVAPVLEGGAVLFGEVGKLVAVSAQRVTSIDSSTVAGGGASFSVAFVGDTSGETVAFAFACAGGQPIVASCSFPQQSRLNVTCAAQQAGAFACLRS
jgi:hypothetical protein